MRWPRISGALWAAAFAGALGTWDAARGKASLAAALGSGGLVAAMWGAPALVGALVLDRWTRGRPLAAARCRVALAGIAFGALVLAWVRGPMLARWNDRVLAGWLWAALAVALLAVGVSVGEPLARRLAARPHDDARVPVVSLAVALALLGWIAWSLTAAPPVRGLAAHLRV
jgi:hypothetical protein